MTNRHRNLPDLLLRAVVAMAMMVAVIAAPSRHATCLQTDRQHAAAPQPSCCGPACPAPAPATPANVPPSSGTPLCCFALVGPAAILDPAATRVVVRASAPEPAPHPILVVQPGRLWSTTARQHEEPADPANRDLLARHCILRC